MSNVEEKEKLLTVTELAEELKVPVSWLYERTRTGNLPGQMRFGRHIRFRLSDVLEAAARNKIA